jgi:putative membrane protein
MPPEDHGRDLSKAQQHLANERTFLSWLRTSIALIGLGFIIARFGLFLREFNLLLGAERGDAAVTSIAEYSFSSYLGLSMVVLGVGLIILALKNYRDGNKEIDRGVYLPKNGVVYTAGLALVIFGIVMVAYLVTVSFL